MKKLLVPWACPKCGAPANDHGKDPCGEGLCSGLICECADESTEANCYCCGWGGQVPVMPKKLQPFEKKALEAGWMPPAARAKELGMK